MPPRNSASVSASAVRSAPKLGRPGRLARNSPSGASARRIWISAPGRSFTQWSEREATTRSKAPSAKGRNSSSAATAKPPPRAAMPGARSAETMKGMPRAASFGATKPRPPRSSARVKRRVVSSSLSSSLSAASSRMGATRSTCATARARRRATRARSKTRIWSVMAPWDAPCFPSAQDGVGFSLNLPLEEKP